MTDITNLTLVERAQRLNWLHWGETPSLRGANSLSSIYTDYLGIYRSLCEKLEYAEEAYEVTLMLWRAQLRQELGSPLAGLDALHICNDNQITIPEYFVRALQGQILDGIFQRSDAQRGRSGSLWGRLQKVLAQQKQGNHPVVAACLR